jgi:ABC-2 type transport system ATP-binding protein
MGSPYAPPVPGIAVSVRDLVVRYGQRTAVSGLSFDAPENAVTAVVGPNGAGKTSTVEVCVGLLAPASGSVEVLAGRVGVMLQDGGLYPTARPLELVRHIAELYPVHDDPADLLASLGIDPGTRTPVRRLSGGEQQQVKCAAALVGRPELVFLDEPTAGLDAVARRSFHTLVRSLVARGTSVVLTTHLMDDVERLADHVVVMAGGRDIRHGTVAELVGGEEIITFTGPPHVDLAGLRDALPPGAVVDVGHDGRYRVTGAADPRVLVTVASWCAEHGVPAGGLSMGRRPLEDVIIELVGDL